MGIILHVLFWLVVIGWIAALCWIVFKVWRNQKPDQPHLLAKPSQPDDFYNGYLLVERVSGEYRAETELQVIKRAHSDLLAAGDAVLELPTSDSVRNTLSAPISEELKNRVAYGDIDARLTPQRVRAAVAVGEISMELESLMQQFGDHQADTLSVVLDKLHGVIYIGDQQISVGYVIHKIESKIEMPDTWECGDEYRGGVHGYAAASQIWDAVVELLREGKTRIPGLRANNDILILPRIIINDKS